MGTHLRDLSESFPMDTHMTGFRLSIGSVKYLEEMVKNTQTLFDPSIPVIPKIKLTFK